MISDLIFFLIVIPLLITMFLDLYEINPLQLLTRKLRRSYVAWSYRRQQQSK